MIVNQVMVEVYHLAARHLHDRALGGTQTSSVADATTTAQMQTSQTSAAPTPTMTQSNGSGGPTSSPLLFFVALGFGVVFTNLWIIVGVKYCFRYNARNRAIRNGEDPDPINLENMPARPHRRRREKKLMTMDEVNDRFPLTKYKNWVASRAREGLPTAGGVTASPSRAGSLRNVDGAMPSSPVDTKHSINTRPATANSEGETAGITVAPTSNVAGNLGERKSMEANVIEKENATTNVEEHNSLEQVRTTTSTVNKHATATSEVDEDDEDDHIHTAVPPELLTNPGDSCAICIDTLEEDDDIRGLTCGHAFHAGCLDPWLTSRRACCPLCKADYYTPKPRPEGEAVEAERSGRRSRDPRINMPQAPTSAWTGIRGNPRFILPGRFGASRGGHAGDNAAYGPDQTRRSARRARRQADVQAQPAAADAGAAENQEQAAPRRWNPFSSVRMPRLPGRNRQQDVPAAQNATAEPSPSQLEAGVVR